ncbi:MAG: hypothetical protein ACRDRR_16125 [Pseudonocardiaceae bacterium]
MPAATGGRVVVQACDSEQAAVGRLATARLISPEADGIRVVVDLLFAAAGIEAEIVADAEELEILLHCSAARTAVDLMVERGFGRGRPLPALLDLYLGDAEPRTACRGGPTAGPRDPDLRGGSPGPPPPVSADSTHGAMTFGKREFSVMAIGATLRARAGRRADARGDPSCI